MKKNITITIQKVEGVEGIALCEVDTEALEQAIAETLNVSFITFAQRWVFKFCRKGGKYTFLLKGGYCYDAVTGDLMGFLPQSRTLYSTKQVSRSHYRAFKREFEAMGVSVIRGVLRLDLFGLIARPNTEPTPFLRGRRADISQRRKHLRRLSRH
jgi:hypothetical protein